MRKVANFLLWLYIFTVPWDVVAVPGVGTLTRVMGMIAISAVVLMVLGEGRFRKPDLITIVAAIFTGISALSILWTISYPATTEAVWSYIQLFGSVWAVRETAQTQQDRHRLSVAFCLGVFVPMIDLLVRYVTGSAVGDSARYTATGQNADTVGSLLVVGIPIAWQLMMTSAGASRLVGGTYVVLAPLEVLLTGVRGAFLALLISMSVIPLSLGKVSRRWMVRAVAALLLGTAAAVPLVPSSTWTRIGTIPSEILGGGSLSSRREIWGAGLAVFPEHPLLGAGAGTYGVLLQDAGYHANPAHNLFIGLLVEQGIIGLSAFVALLVAAASTIRRMPPFERKTWGVLMLSFALTLLSQSLERWKVTWLLLAMLAARNEIGVARSYPSRVPVRASIDAIPVKPT